MWTLLLSFMSTLVVRRITGHTKSRQTQDPPPKMNKLMNLKKTIRDQDGIVNIKPLKTFLTFREASNGKKRSNGKSPALIGSQDKEDIQEQTSPLGHGNLYTRREVEELLEKNGGNTSSLDIELEKEGQERNRQKRLNDLAVEKLVKKSNRILASISSRAFPIDLFPDLINVEEGKVTITSRHFSSSVVHSVDVKDISNVFINKSIFFAQLVITSNTFENNEVRMKNLRLKEAVFVRKIIEGLRLFADNEIETADYSKKELIAKLEEISTTEIGEVKEVR